MKKIILFTVASTLTVCLAQAQDEVTVTAVAEPTQQVTASPTTQVTVTSQPTLTANNYEKQPTTVIESTPLSVSRSEQLRKDRERAEVDTEQKIVERLEQSRMEAERRRQEDILGALTPQVPVVVAAPVVAAPVVAAPVVAAPVVAAPVVQQSPTIQATGSNVEVSNNSVSMLPVAAVVVKHNASDKYMSGQLGMIDYDSVDVQTIGSVGVAFGSIFEDRWAVEFGVSAANAYVDESAFLYRKMMQFNSGLTTKFMILTDSVRPWVGFLVNYIYRDYSELRDSGMGWSVPSEDLTSWAVDYGFSTGIDFIVAKTFSMGFEYRYMSNLTYAMDKEILNTASNRNYFDEYQPIEERDSEYLGFSVKYTF